MPTLYLRDALGLLLKTTPILWVRIGSYALLGLGLLVYAAVVGGLAWLLSQLWGVLGLLVLEFAGFDHRMPLDVRVGHAVLPSSERFQTTV